MDQQPGESASDLEIPAVEVQSPKAPKARLPRSSRLVLVLSALAILLVVGVSLGGYLVITHVHQGPAPITGARLTLTATKTLA